MREISISIQFSSNSLITEMAAAKGPCVFVWLQFETWGKKKKKKISIMTWNCAHVEQNKTSPYHLLTYEDNLEGIREHQKEDLSRLKTRKEWTEKEIWQSTNLCPHPLPFLCGNTDNSESAAMLKNTPSIATPQRRPSASITKWIISNKRCHCHIVLQEM